MARKSPNYRVDSESYGDRKPRKQFGASLQYKSFFVVALNNLSAAMIGLRWGEKRDLKGVPYFARETQLHEAITDSMYNLFDESIQR
ncbi:hypothetical protein CDAR_564951 [Caerostris darwini]|uniref:Uncharacterized protein n=1 Tax=Caerostris darwini TaxID=1538125 RepID=A0AAV4URR0_9ARAC|nr:hypothetical protein CDAR_564951 [Caerostris darwini]